MLGGKIVNPLSIDPNERVTPSHHSGTNGLIDPMVDPSSGEMNQSTSQSGINGDIGGVDGAELMASLAVTEIGVIPPPPMFSCSPSPPPPPPAIAIDHRASHINAHSTSSVVQPGHIVTVSSHVLHQQQSSNLASIIQQQAVQTNNVFHNHAISSVQMTNNNSSVITVMSNSNHSHSYHPHNHHDPRHLNAYEYQHHPGNLYC